MSEHELVERVAKALCSYPFDLYERIKDDPNEETDKWLLLEQMEGWRVMARRAITEFCRRVEPDKPDIAQDK